MIRNHGSCCSDAFECSSVGSDNVGCPPSSDKGYCYSNVGFACAKSDFKKKNIFAVDNRIKNSLDDVFC